jgi:hypothetical protein
MPLTIKKKGVEQKQKQKQKQFGPLFFGLDVFFGVWLSLSIFLVKLAFFFPSFGQWQLIRTGPNVCCVPVPLSGNAVRVGSSDEPRIRFPGLMPSI